MRWYGYGAGWALLWMLAGPVEAVPAFARKYGMSCALCHKAFPHLNSTGENFAANGYLFGGSPGKAMDTGDGMLHLPDRVPLAFRFQQWGEFRTFGEARADIQAPYSVKLLSGGALGENLRYYAYIIYEKGEPPKFEDAWVEWRNLPGGLALTLGQFQISDFMFMRETRLTRSDFMVYRVAPGANGFALTYHRGVVVGLPWLDAVVGVVNGNGIHEATPIQDVGAGRPYRDFDNNTAKVGFTHLVLPTPLPVGLLALYGQDSLPDASGTLQVNRFYRFGVDLRLDRDTWDAFAQGLWGYDANPFYQAGGTPKVFYGGFVGVNWTEDFPIVYSAILNYVETPEPDPSYRAIRTFTLAVNVSYYLYRNARVYVEAQGDFLPQDASHPQPEHLLTLGVDFAL